MTAAFGTPAPLPGQPGFRAKPSESMARETKEMEERLARLKTDLAAEAEMREAAGPRAGGSRWRSARTDRGSVRAYAKDVKTRHKQQLQQRPPHGIFATGGGGAAASGLGVGKVQPQGGAGARVAAALRGEQQQHYRQQQGQADARTEGSLTSAEVRSKFESKEVSQWGVGDTLQWLDSLGLRQHSGVFQQNEISGPILLEVGLDDLDYMDIRVLAHRKRILKGIEDLRRGRRGSCGADVPPPPAPPPPQLSKGANNSSGCGSGRRGEVEKTGTTPISTQPSGQDRSGVDHPSSPRSTKIRHWSTVTPLSETQLKNDPPPAVNLADGRYDESAAHSSFAEAVAEWRGGGRGNRKSISSTTTATTEAPPPSLHRPSVVGRAPLAGTPAGQPEKEGVQVPKIASSSGGGASGRRSTPGLLGGAGGSGEGGGATDCWTNPFCSPRPSGYGAAARQEPQLVDLDPEPNSPPRRTKTAVTVASAGRQEGREAGTSDAPVLDEEGEHAAFRRAVAEWNRGGADSVAVERGGGGSGSGRAGARSRTETVTAGASTGTGPLPLPGSRTTEAMADELRKQMDAEHRAQAKALEEKRRELLEGLDEAAAARSASKMDQQQRAAAGQNGGAAGNHEEVSRGGSSMTESDGDESGGLGSEEMLGRNGVKEDDDRSASLSSATSSVVSTAARSSSEDQEDTEVPMMGVGLQQTQGGGGSVEIEIMDSVLGVDLSDNVGAGYVVDEGDSSGEDHFESS